MGDFDKSSLDQQWASMRQVRDSFVKKANDDWLPKLDAGTSRIIIEEIGDTATGLLKKLQFGIPADVTEQARRDLARPAFDPVVWYAAATSAAQTLTLQVETDFNLAEGELFGIARDENGRLSRVQIPSSPAQLLNLRNAIAAVVAALA